MKYEIASSSTEEGHGQSFPHSKSHWKYLFYPKTSTFIGKNTMPRMENYVNASVSQKLKKSIKNEYSYISFTLLEDNKQFFDNKFSHVTDLVAQTETPILIDSRTSVDAQEEEKSYEKLFQKFFFAGLGDCNPKVLLLEDSVLDSLSNEDAYIFLRVVDCEQAGRRVQRYAFEREFYSAARFYKYLEIVAKELLKSRGNEELRKYQCGDAIVYLYSGSVADGPDGIQRVYGVPGSAKNAIPIFNRNEMVLKDFQGGCGCNPADLVALDLPEGDYVINNRKVYKMSSDGAKFEYKGLLYDDFN